MDNQKRRRFSRCDLELILLYLQNGETLPNSETFKDKYQRFHFKLRASDFIADNNKLFYIRPRAAFRQENRIPQRKLVLFSNEDRLQAFYECHIKGTNGEHFGKNRTFQNFSEKYYVPSLFEMINRLMKNCPVCCERTVKLTCQKDDMEILNQYYGERHSNHVLCTDKNINTQLNDDSDHKITEEGLWVADNMTCEVTTDVDNVNIIKDEIVKDDIIERNDDKQDQKGKKETHERFDGEGFKPNNGSPNLKVPLRPDDSVHVVGEDTSRNDPLKSKVIIEPGHFWHSVEVCVFGPFDNQKYVLVFLDLYSTWPEVMVLDTVTPNIVTMGFLNLSCRYNMMKKLYLRKSDCIPVSSFTPDVRILESADLHVDISEMNIDFTEHVWKSIKDLVTSFIERNSDWTSSLSFALIPLRMTQNENEPCSLFIYNKRQVPKEDEIKKRLSRFKTSQEKLLMAYRSCTGLSSPLRGNKSQSVSQKLRETDKSKPSVTVCPSESDVIETQINEANVNCYENSELNKISTRSSGKSGLENLDLTCPRISTRASCKGNFNSQSVVDTKKTGIQTEMKRKYSDEITTKEGDQDESHVKKQATGNKHPNRSVKMIGLDHSYTNDSYDMEIAEDSSKEDKEDGSRILNSENDSTSGMPTGSFEDNKQLSAAKKSYEKMYELTVESNKIKISGGLLKVENLPMKSKDVQVSKNLAVRRVSRRLISFSGPTKQQNLTKSIESPTVDPTSTVIRPKEKPLDKSATRPKKRNKVELTLINTTVAKNTSEGKSNPGPQNLPVGNAPGMIIGWSKEGTNVQEQKSRIFRCEICNINFKSRTHYKYHHKSHQSLQIKCEKCEKIFHYKSALKMHEASRHSNSRKSNSSMDGPQACTICDKRFQSGKLLKAHQRYHKNSNPTSLCNICGKTVMKLYIKAHIKLHSKSNRLECKECFRGFFTQEGLNAHMNYKHAKGPQLFECSVCRRRYKRKASMYRHFRAQHQNLRPFMCDKCGKCYYRNEYLADHQTTCKKSSKSSATETKTAPIKQEKIEPKKNLAGKLPESDVETENVSESENKIIIEMNDFTDVQEVTHYVTHITESGVQYHVLSDTAEDALNTETIEALEMLSQLETS